MDDKTNLKELKEIVKSFCEERDWDQYHGAKDLAHALIIEVAELLEHFRWKSEEEVKKLLENAEKREHIGDELADIFYFLLRFSQMYDFDLAEILNRKMKKNRKKYPVKRARGSNKKYTEYEK